MIVAAFGTSLTHLGGWLDPLERELAKCLARPVKVIDFAKSGKNSEWGRTAVLDVIRAEPDVVLIEFSSNDAAWFKGVSRSRSSENTAFIISEIKRSLPQTRIFLMTMSPSLGLRRWIRPNVDSYYDLYQPLARDLGVGYIDNRPSWVSLDAEQLRAGIPDGAHPSPQLASKLLVPSISRAVVDGRCPTSQ